ncbi:hypothetical protein CR513_59311, partial [Mucuna pruriens]
TRLKTSYQIGAVAGDTSSFVSLCVKIELSRISSLWNAMSIRLGRNIDGCGMYGSVRHLTHDCPILQEPPLLFRPQPKAMNNMQFPQKESFLGNWTNHMLISNMEFQEDMCTTL